MRDAGGEVRLTVVTALFLLVAAVLWGAAPTLAVAAGESAFVGLTPCRLADTRGNGFGGPFGPPALAIGVPRDFPLQGQCGIPAAATAVSLNVTAANTRGPGFLLLYPQGGVQPLVSTLNYVAGETVANAALVPLGAGGLTVVAGVSGTDLILDVNGYFTDALVHAVDTDNLFVGQAAGNPATSGSGNTALGSEALAANTIGEANVAIGMRALVSNLGGDRNTAVGARALRSNANGVGNVAVGENALGSNTVGGGNIAIGDSAGSIPVDGFLNIHIGHGGVSTDSHTIRVGLPGVHTSTFIAGINGTTINGGVPVAIDLNGKLGAVASSRRLKTDIGDIGERSGGLHALRPVSFRYRVQPDGPVEYGLIAEEVAEVYPELIVRDGEGAPLTVRYHLLPALLLNELQAAMAQIAELRAAVTELAGQLARLNGRGSTAPQPSVDRP